MRSCHRSKGERCRARPTSSVHAIRCTREARDLRARGPPSARRRRRRPRRRPPVPGRHGHVRRRRRPGAGLGREQARRCRATTRTRSARCELARAARPPVILNSGQNYWDHRDEKPEVDQKEPEFFLKTPFAVIGPDEPVLYDSVVTKKLDYEVELAVIIGKPGRHIPVAARSRARLRLHDRERRDRARPAGRPAPAGWLGVRARAGQELRHLGAARARGS